MSDIIEAATKEEEARRGNFSKANAELTAAQDAVRAARLQLQTAVKQAELVIHLATPTGSPARRLLHRGGRRKGVAPRGPVVPVEPPVPAPMVVPAGPVAPLKLVQVG